MQKDHESLKASHYYKASSLENKLEAHVEQSVKLKTKISRINTMLVTLC